MSGPEAGWYIDPADPGQERWWGGLEWTHNVRQRAAPVTPVVATPALLDVPGGGINPFAAIDAEEARRSAAAGNSYATSPTPAAPYGGVTHPTPQAPQAAWGQSNWQPAPGPPPGNGFALAGFILSVVGAHLFGIIFSILGLVRASNLSRSGEAPRGRALAVSGLLIGILAPVALTAIAVPVYLGQQERIRNEVAQVAEDNGVLPSDVVVEWDGRPAVYDRAVYEQEFSDAFAEGAGAPPDWITCPDSVDLYVGSEFTCQFAFRAVNHVLVITIADVDGTSSATLDGVPIQQ